MFSKRVHLFTRIRLRWSGSVHTGVGESCGEPLQPSFLLETSGGLQCIRRCRFRYRPPKSHRLEYTSLTFLGGTMAERQDPQKPPHGQGPHTYSAQLIAPLRSIRSTPPDGASGQGCRERFLFFVKYLFNRSQHAESSIFIAACRSWFPEQGLSWGLLELGTQSLSYWTTGKSPLFCLNINGWKLDVFICRIAQFTRDLSFLARAQTCATCSGSTNS